MFARAPLPGRCKTRLAKTVGDVAAAELYEALLVDTMARLSVITDTRKVLLAATEHDGVAVLTRMAPPDWDVVPQHPGDLTERLVDAFGALGAGGATVICVGSDAPFVSTDALHVALHDQAHDVMVGPSRDGGYWAIGMRELRRELLTNMPWSTDKVTSETLQRCQKLGLSVAFLPESFDVDEAEDLLALREAVEAAPDVAPRVAQWLTRDTSH